MGRRDRDRFDGVRVTAHPRRARGAVQVLAMLALVAIVAGLGWWTMARRASSSTAAIRTAQVTRRDAGPSPIDDAAPTPTRAASRGIGAGTAAATRDGEDPTPDLSDYVLPGEAPTMREVIDALHARGIRTGLGAFPPPGTRPPRRGLEVPDGFPLPDGYVRHHQATDDGQSISPILMFSPDIDSITVRGRRVAIPPDRIVPPDLAPPGMPLKWVTLPPPRTEGPSP
ncbi:hypothetical protein [Lysobacter xanthus]